MCLEREPGLNHGAVAVTSDLDLRGLPLTGLLRAFSSISAFALIAAFAAMYSVFKVGGSWGRSLRSGCPPRAQFPGTFPPSRADRRGHAEAARGLESGEQAEVSG